MGDNGTNHRIEDAADVGLPGPARAVSTDGTHSCALMVTGKVRCWGRGTYGALGSDDTLDVTRGEDTVEVPLPDPATAVATGGGATCAIMTTGKARCWGDGQNGRLGHDSVGNTGDSPGSVEDTPDVILPPTAKVRAIAMGSLHACAVFDTTSPAQTGRLRCWGYNGGGQLGADSTDTIGDAPGSMAAAQDVPLPAAVKVVSAGDSNTCAVLVTGKVRCWGFGYSGANGRDSQDDIGTTPGSMAAAGDVILPADALTVTAGGDFACALLVTGKVRCWGRGLFGRLGNDASGSVGDSAGSMAGAANVLLPADLRTSAANLRLTVTPSASQVQEGGSAAITVKVTNDGPATATGPITVRAPVPGGTALQNSVAGTGLYNPATSVWSIGVSIGAGQSYTLSLTVAFGNGYSQPTAGYEITRSDVVDPNSTPDNGVAGEDDSDTVTLEVTPRADDESPPARTPIYQYQSQWGSHGSADGQFDKPWDVAVDQSNSPPYVLVSDFGNSRLETFLQGGFVTKVGTYGSGAGELRNPAGLALRNRRAFVVDTGAQLGPRVQAYDTLTAPPTYAFQFAQDGSVNFPGSTNHPRDVAVSPFNGHLYVTDAPFKSVQEYDAAGGFLRQLGSGFAGPMAGQGADGIAVSRAGTIFVADQGNGRVRVYGADGAFVRDIGTPGRCADAPSPPSPPCGNSAYDGRFDDPSGIALDQVRRVLYVVDQGNARVQAFDLAGHYLTQFGVPGAGNGQLDDPHGIAVDPRDGNVYVADTGNDRIQVFRTVVPAPPPPPPPENGGGTGGGGAEPVQPCAGNTAPISVVAGLAKVTGCLTRLVTGTYGSQTGTVLRLNGVPLQTFGKKFIVDPNAKSPSLKVQDEGAGQLSLDGVVVYQGPLNLKLPTADNPVDEKSLVSLGAKGSVYGLKLAGNFGLSLGRSGKDGPYYASFALKVALPEVFKFASGDGGVSAAVAVKVDETGAVNSNGVNFTVEDLYLGPLKVNRACFALIPGGSTAVQECAQPTPYEFKKGPLNATQSGNEGYLTCKPDDEPSGAHWSTAVALQLPTPARTQIGVYGSGTGPELRSLGGFGAQLGIPIADGVSLETLGAGLCLPTTANPEFAIKGTVGIGLVPVGSGSLVTVDGSISYRVNTRTPEKWSLGFDGDVSIKDFGRIGSGGVQVFSSGTFGASVAVNARVAGFLILKGSVAGAYAPKTKEFFVEGGVTLCPPDGSDTFCAGGKAIVSNTGVAACVTATSWFGAGFGYTWDTKKLEVLGGTCSFDAYRPTIVARAAASGGPSLVTVPAGARAIGLRAVGAHAPPGIRITGPGGFDISLPADVPLERTATRVVIRNPQDNSTNVALGDLRPGAYTVTALDEGNPITGLDTAKALARFSARGRIRNAGGARKRLDVSYVVPHGGAVALVETAAGGGGQDAVRHVVAPKLRGRACPGRQVKIEGGTRRCASVAFTPADGPGGSRAIEAEVTRGGLPTDGAIVARFRAKAKARTARPRVSLRRSGSTVTVRWAATVGAQQYGATVQVAGRSPLSRFLAGRCGALRVTRVPRGTTVKVAIAAIGADGVPGRSSAATIKPRKASGGVGKLRGGRLCR